MGMRYLPILMKFLQVCFNVAQRIIRPSLASSVPCQPVNAIYLGNVQGDAG